MLMRESPQSNSSVSYITISASSGVECKVVLQILDPQVCVRVLPGGFKFHSRKLSGKLLTLSLQTLPQAKQRAAVASMFLKFRSKHFLGFVIFSAKNQNASQRFS